MGQPRLRGEGIHFVHAISRIVDRRFIFEDDEKEYFCELVRRLSGFTGLDVVAFCVMGNHFHLLIEQPDRATLPALTKPELLRRAKFLYDANTIKDLEHEFQRAEKTGDQPWVRYLTDGAVFGHATFVDQIFAANREHFRKRRTSGAQRMRGGHWGELRVLRDLQSES